MNHFLLEGNRELRGSGGPQAEVREKLDQLQHILTRANKFFDSVQQTTLYEDTAWTAASLTEEEHAQERRRKLETAEVKKRKPKAKAKAASKAAAKGQAKSPRKAKGTRAADQEGAANAEELFKHFKSLHSPESAKLMELLGKASGSEPSAPSEKEEDGSAQ